MLHIIQNSGCAAYTRVWRLFGIFLYCSPLHFYGQGFSLTDLELTDLARLDACLSLPSLGLQACDS